MPFSKSSMSRTRVKICGITRPEDAVGAAELGADAIGLVFYPPSPRHVDLKTARAVVNSLPPFVSAVGLFLDAELERVRAVLDSVALGHAAVFTGVSSRCIVSHLAAATSKRYRWVVASPLDSMLSHSRVRAVSCSTAMSQVPPVEPGSCSTGKGFPRHSVRPLILAGGLAPENVGEAISHVAPYGVDVSSGVESARGVKDMGLIEAFYSRCLEVANLAEAFTHYDLPDRRGHFGPYGGRFVAETLMAALDELTAAYEHYREGRAVSWLNCSRISRISLVALRPFTWRGRWSDQLGGARIYLKREDLNHTGAHKVNNTVGQALLAERMGKRRIIAETGAGQHGVATATVAARMGMECVVYMGSEDIKRQAINVYRMKLLGAEVVPVESGSKTLKDALNEALRDWVTNVDDTFYIIGTVAGPHPYPAMVRDFHRVIGLEAREQIIAAEGRLPDALVACVGGGSKRHWVVSSLHPRRGGCHLRGGSGWRRRGNGAACSAPHSGSTRRSSR